MFIKELSLRGKSARIICYPNQGMRIHCDRLDISLTELKILQLKTKGYTLEEIAGELRLTFGDVRNRVMDLRKRNSWVGAKDPNNIGVTGKVRELELFRPLAQIGLRTILDEGNAYHTNRRAAKSNNGAPIA